VSHRVSVRTKRLSAHGDRGTDEHWKSAGTVSCAVSFAGKRGLIVLDQIRTLDEKRLIKRLGKAQPRIVALALRTLRDVFAD
jgi:mRNA-degrading endonuclease toxin of MazEF toxin-antitoxin module